jgi:hypothetical protein
MFGTNYPPSAKYPLNRRKINNMKSENRSYKRDFCLVYILLGLHFYRSLRSRVAEGLFAREV